MSTFKKGLIDFAKSFLRETAASGVGAKGALMTEHPKTFITTDRNQLFAFIGQLDSVMQNKMFGHLSELGKNKEGDGLINGLAGHVSFLASSRTPEEIKQALNGFAELDIGDLKTRLKVLQGRTFAENAGDSFRQLDENVAGLIKGVRLELEKRGIKR